MMRSGKFASLLFAALAGSLLLSSPALAGSNAFGLHYKKHDFKQDHVHKVHYKKKKHSHGHKHHYKKKRHGHGHKWHKGHGYHKGYQKGYRKGYRHAKRQHRKWHRAHRRYLRHLQSTGPPFRGPGHAGGAADVTAASLPRQGRPTSR